MSELTPEQEAELQDLAESLRQLWPRSEQPELVYAAVRELDRLRTERDKLQKFKDFVHGRLDAAGVPKEFPDGPHSREGCRIGDRLDYLAADVELLGQMRPRYAEQCDELDRLRQRVADLESRLEKCEQSERARWNDIEN